jgi:hypothetical protein
VSRKGAVAKLWKIREEIGFSFAARTAKWFLRRGAGSPAGAAEFVELRGEKDSGDRHGHLAVARTRKLDPTSRHGGWQRRLTFTWYSVLLELVFVDN